MSEAVRVPSGEQPGEDGNCAWGRAIEAAWAEREKASPVVLPAGWTRVFAAHHSCAPSIRFWQPGSRPLRHTPEDLAELKIFRRNFAPTFTVCPSCEEIEMSGATLVTLDPKDLARVGAIAVLDYAWLQGYFAEHGDECTHGVEADALRGDA